MATEQSGEVLDVCSLHLADIDADDELSAFECNAEILDAPCNVR